MDTTIYRQGLVKTPDIKKIKVVTFMFLLKFPTARKQLRQEQKFPIYSQEEYKRVFCNNTKVLQNKTTKTLSMSLTYLLRVKL